MRSRWDSNPRIQGFADLALKPLEYATCGAPWSRTRSCRFSVYRAHRLRQSPSISVPIFRKLKQITDPMQYVFIHNASFPSIDLVDVGVFRKTPPNDLPSEVSCRRFLTTPTVKVDVRIMKYTIMLRLLESNQVSLL